MENNLELRKVGEEMTTGKIGEIDQELDANQYMDIDEFMGVLRDVELITPFGKLESTAADMVQIDDKAVELEHRCTERSDHRCSGIGRLEDKTHRATGCRNSTKLPQKLMQGTLSLLETAHSKSFRGCHNDKLLVLFS